MKREKGTPSSHTKGDWKQDHTLSTEIQICEAKGGRIITALKYPPTKKDELFFISDVLEIQANARLISEAPKMRSFINSFYHSFNKHGLFPINQAIVEEMNRILEATK